MYICKQHLLAKVRMPYDSCELLNTMPCNIINPIQKMKQLSNKTTANYTSLTHKNHIFAEKHTKLIKLWFH
jgi:hypothetical protein